jgi:ferric-dicitrate binding protein FerR (iron transport regulator)
MDKYINYQAEDFAIDEFFQKWVSKEDQSATVFWEKFIASYPEKISEIQEAIHLLQSLKPSKSLQDYEKETNEAINRFQLSIQREKNLGHKPSSFNHSFSNNLRKIAASLLILSIIGFAGYLLYQNYFAFETYQTAFGETRKITLPDGSLVTLNSNSSLTLNNNWQDAEKREVWLSGEAFFSVKKVQSSQTSQKIKFVVHSENVDVEVLGTQFNVWSRQAKVAVVLNEGKIQLKIKNQSQNVQTVAMLPNERVEVQQNEFTFAKKQVNPELYTSWQAQELTFDNTPLSQVAEKIEEIYGLKVKFQDAEMPHEVLTGVIPCKNEQHFFKILSVALNMKITKSNKKPEVIFSRLE